jgi:hypothetical protein
MYVFVSSDAAELKSGLNDLWISELVKPSHSCSR